jgi:hypothetical protein
MHAACGITTDSRIFLEKMAFLLLPSPLPFSVLFRKAYWKTHISTDPEKIPALVRKRSPGFWLAVDPRSLRSLHTDGVTADESTASLEGARFWR